MWDCCLQDRKTASIIKTLKGYKPSGCYDVCFQPQDDLLHISLDELTALLTGLDRSESKETGEVNVPASNEDGPVLFRVFDAAIDDQPVQADSVEPDSGS
jgi:hypothetical protein